MRQQMGVFGYAVAKNPVQIAAQVKRVHFMGAELVLSDKPVGQVRNRPGYRVLRKLTRAGDRVILGNNECLGTKSDYQASQLRQFEAASLDVRVLV